MPIGTARNLRTSLVKNSSCISHLVTRSVSEHSSFTNSVVLAVEKLTVSSDSVITNEHIEEISKRFGRESGLAAFTAPKPGLPFIKIKVIKELKVSNNADRKALNEAVRKFIATGMWPNEHR